MKIPSYIGEPIVKVLADEENVEMQSTFGFMCSDGYNYWTYPGDQTDGASIPRIFWRLIGSPFTGKYRWAAFLHDRGYRHKGNMRTDQVFGRPAKAATRKEVDDMFLEAMGVSGEGLIHRTIIYYAVRLFGPRWEPVERLKVMQQVQLKGMIK